MSELKQCPKVIYLQPHMDPEITWCVDKIEDTDVKYIRADVARLAEDALRKRVEELEAEATMGNIPYRDAIRLQKRVEELEGALTEIKQWRLSALKSSCVDCEEDYGRTCDHGASHCPIVKRCNEALTPPATKEGE